MVNEILKEELATGVHALSIQVMLVMFLFTTDILGSMKILQILLFVDFVGWRWLCKN